MTLIRNIAIIAHVDHGKTTFVDTMLKQSGTFRDNQQVAERAMDSNDLEKERGITILAKCTSLMWNNVKINIVDTPGHADFGGEVERILSMVDGVVLLVDAAEGPMPQTKFVLSKALALGLMPIVVINKIDRQDERHGEVLEEIYDLFFALDATEKQLDFKILYASGRGGWAVNNLEDERVNVAPLFDLILSEISPPTSDTTSPFSMLVTNIEYDNHLGRILTGKIQTGVVKTNMSIKALNQTAEIVDSGRVTRILSFQGLERAFVDNASAGDIIAIAGLSKATITDTIVVPEVTTPLPAKPIDPPTLSINFAINTSPLAGKEGSKLTSSLLKDRLLKEIESNVAIKITESADRDSFEVAGRGELQLGVLIETMRREGFELSVSRPKVLLQKDPNNNETLEPFEEVHIDVDNDFTGTVISAMANRKGEMLEMKNSGLTKTKLTFIAPARALIGYQGQLLNDTRGTAIMSRIFHSYKPFCGHIEGRRNGVMYSTDTGTATDYALWKLEERGFFFIPGGVEVYEGMIIGESNKPGDLGINPVKGKKLSNVRASGKDDAIKLTPPKLLTLEQAISYIQDDELVEVTPKSIRLRKIKI